MKSTPKKAVSISIAAEWGNGKTVFLDFLEKDLKNGNNIIIKFNPWLTRLSGSTVGLFFDILRDELSKYDTRIADKIHKYSNNILLIDTEDSFVLKFIKLIINVFVPGSGVKSITDQKNDINNLIEVSGKKIIIFIDDLDRVSAEEILEIMNLIRNTADFRNTIFIVAMDIDYIKSSLNSQSAALDVDKYLEKIFQVQFVLSPIMQDSIKTLLEEELEQYFKLNDSTAFPDNFLEEVSESLALISSNSDTFSEMTGNNSRYLPGILEESITNIRDIKRFANSFLLTYNLLGGELSLKDLILLELLKLKFTEVYLQLAKGQLLRIDPSKFDQWAINSPMPFKHLEANKYKLATKIIEELYNPQKTIPLKSKQAKERALNSVIYLDNHKKYFNHDLFGDLYVKGLLKAKDGGISTLKTYFQAMLNESLNFIITEEKLKSRKVYRVDNYFKLLITYSDSEVDKLNILESIKFLGYLKTFHFPEALKDFILISLENNSFKKSNFDITISRLFKSNETDLPFTIALYKYNKKTFPSETLSNYQCIINLADSFFPEKQSIKKVEANFQREALFIMDEFLSKKENISSEKESSIFKRFRKYLEVNPELFLIRVFKIDKNSGNLLWDDNYDSLFYHWNLDVTPKNNFFRLLENHKNELKLADYYHNKLFSKNNFNEFVLAPNEYAEALKLDNLQKHLPLSLSRLSNG